MSLMRFTRRILLLGVTLALAASALAPAAAAQDPAPVAAQEHRPGGEVNIELPSLDQGDFLGYTGHQILLSGLVVCVLGLLFGWWSYLAVRRLPVHRSMAEISAIIYETCKAYLVQQGKLLLALFAFIGTVIVVYFLMTGLEPAKIAVICCSVCREAGSYGARGSAFASTRSPTRALRSRVGREGITLHEMPLPPGWRCMMLSLSSCCSCRDPGFIPST